MNSRRAQRSQALVEFALVSPVLLLLSFGIVDFGRGLYFYVTIGNSAREVARYAGSSSLPNPTFSKALGVATIHSSGLNLVAPCPNGPIMGTPPPDVGWVYITEPTPPATVETAPPPNAPGGDVPAPAAGACSAVNPALGQVSLQVTIVYNFTPVTPVIRQAVANRILLLSRVIFTTEY